MSPSTPPGKDHESPFYERLLQTKVGSYFETLVLRILRGDIMSRASSLSYDLLMAIIPLLLLFLMMSSFVLSNPASPIQDVIALMPNPIAELFREVVSVLLENVNAGTIGLGLFSAIWLGSDGIDKLILGINESLDFTMRGNGVGRRILSIFYTVIFFIGIMVILVFFAFSGSLIQVAENMLDWTGIEILKGAVAVFNSVTARLLPFLLLLLLVVLFYRTAPVVSHGSVRWREALMGGFVSALGILLLTVAYGWVLENVSRLSLYFGSLAGLLGLFVWLKYTSLLILFGAEIIAARRVWRKKKMDLSLHSSDDPPALENKERGMPGKRSLRDD